MRMLLLGMFVGGLALYAWRDWFRSLCGLIVLTALLEQNNMPKNILGVQGLNPWNILLAAILIPWFLQRVAQRRRWELPAYMALPLTAYLAVTLIAFLRSAVEIGAFDVRHGVSLASFASDEIINPLKLMLVGALVYDGCGSRERFRLGIVSVLLVGVVYALLTIKTMPLDSLTSDNYMAFRYRIERDVGLHANDLAMVLAGSLWSLVACWRLFTPRWARFALGVGIAAVFLALALCFSRAGFLACVGIGFVFGVFQSRKWLVLLPLGLVAICVAVPSVPDRLETGFDDVDAAGSESKDWNMITAGRTTIIWPHVVERIGNAPFLGHGRGEFMKPPLSLIMEAEGELHGHPHNAYLEALLDSGILGLAVILALYIALLTVAIHCCAPSASPEARATGGMALATIGALMITGISSQSFVPTVSMLTLWCTCGLMLRLRVLQRQVALNARSIVPGSARRSPATPALVPQPVVCSPGGTSGLEDA